MAIVSAVRGVVRNVTKTLNAVSRAKLPEEKTRLAILRNVKVVKRSVCGIFLLSFIWCVIIKEWGPYLKDATQSVTRHFQNVRSFTKQ
ncbi:hypothetical protein BBBOND_0201700 [Babesia bigemina]|uniref:Uncharacterized protein n=1 Tax=Babesia bigemina TaxID=5866 RepID=A0A061D319_BABBI|nr:hypothetical protein BBBOND_0201700 [Babesia bigemina]CDR95013.1 hypothetical protein BBBOND_0201700 [Babesia bigemina]|eukprot:XP_012767199.1 hypothetical protein BBBOND_0201700 [Babesia bigemina]